ncbi:hypothetical protein FOCG_08386 [Fusarium oxysporum f. sp. radicis-lycopersici 26381]|uniref:Uncharacterized protein n=4 Tax=Fusarium oxysporum TaxID=5507 RepID=A0A8H5ABU6_FUSOX|nr:uncharacterized protein FOBCDRAFT_324106 [Fusarium oxysporum Fo47]EWZ80917.1 hypothetical protein FOWG_15246 [Fusarium oxysporum f. sp. lycopersici MN25]EXL52595.1 hypothetical protein FOCG_08386 [Fusarium oxysporum f. sp. radicis-lycopersici 26381]KAF5261925.1 hypothetical protein FOXYS1_7371 [Fusarium oxysporum]RKK08675.1 hypothetical protein BFJ65_g16336 [Fusarium oxysporum f. sp. cepae]RYC86022.1 hypothetical protein BFJ63_vAg11050 [Fusarium oxysporum f. sp. narcissi]
MKLSTVLLASHLLWSASAFLAYKEYVVKQWVEDGGPEACGKVMLTDIDCDASLDDAGSTGWQGSIEEGDDFTITDSICAKKCGDSLQEWAAAFAKYCEPEGMRAPNMVEGRRQICDKDAKTGKYCNAIIDSFPDLDDYEELPAKYLCEPCYVRRLWGFDISHYSPANSWIITQRERMDELCPKSVLVEKKASTILQHPATTVQPWLDSSQTPSHVNSEAEATSTPESAATASSTTTAVPSATAPSESNAAERLGDGRLRGHWSLLLVLGINGFYL